MKAPDKVYVKKEKNNVVYSLSVQYDNGGEEYIRKDALLEWAKEKADDYKGTANIRRSFEMMIKKIESL